MAEWTVRSDGVTIAGEEAGEGVPVVCLHGLTATRRYVVMGSRTLERAGHRVLLYDARGHGRSSPAPADAYTYEHLADDLRAVLDERGIDRAVMAGASMGAHTIIRLALDHPDRVAAAAIVTPAHDPDQDDADHPRFERWDRLSHALRTGGVDGFVAAYDVEDVPEKWRETVEKVLRQRLAQHEHPEAVADALRVVPRSRPFGEWDDLTRLEMPAVVVASRDEADPGHPYDTGARYAELMPDAQLLTEEEGKSPLAWQGGRLSRAIADLAARAQPT